MTTTPLTTTSNNSSTMSLPNAAILAGSGPPNVSGDKKDNTFQTELNATEAKKEATPDNIASTVGPGGGSDMPSVPSQPAVLAQPENSDLLPETVDPSISTTEASKTTGQQGKPTSATVLNLNDGSDEEPVNNDQDASGSGTNVNDDDIKSNNLAVARQGPKKPQINASSVFSVGFGTAERRLRNHEADYIADRLRVMVDSGFGPILLAIPTDHNASSPLEMPASPSQMNETTLNQLAVYPRQGLLVSGYVRAFADNTGLYMPNDLVALMTMYAQADHSHVLNSLYNGVGGHFADQLHENETMPHVFPFASGLCLPAPTRLDNPMRMIGSVDSNAIPNEIGLLGDHIHDLDPQDLPPTPAAAINYLYRPDGDTNADTNTNADSNNAPATANDGNAGGVSGSNYALQDGLQVFDLDSDILYLSSFPPQDDAYLFGRLQLEHLAQQHQILGRSPALVSIFNKLYFSDRGDGDGYQRFAPPAAFRRIPENDELHINMMHEDDDQLYDAQRRDDEGFVTIGDTTNQQTGTLRHAGTKTGQLSGDGDDDTADWHGFVDAGSTAVTTAGYIVPDAPSEDDYEDESTLWDTDNDDVVEPSVAVDPGRSNASQGGTGATDNLDNDQDIINVSRQSQSEDMDELRAIIFGANVPQSGTGAAGNLHNQNPAGYSSSAAVINDGVNSVHDEEDSDGQDIANDWSHDEGVYDFPIGPFANGARDYERSNY